MLHVHTTFSDGTLTPRQVADQAAGRFDVILFSDHSDLHWEYRLAFVAAQVSRASLLSAGFPAYLEAIGTAAQAHPELVLLPGMEASPYYYWQGLPLTTGFTLRNWSKHLLVAGIESPADLSALPMYAYGTSRYHPYGGDHGLAPYQEFIDAVAARGGLCFWAHAGTDTVAHFEQVTASTPAHGDDLWRTRGYTGFGASGPSSRLADPGGPWDRALLAYCRGQRERPPWVIAENDYHRGAFPDHPVTVLLATARTRAAVLEALREGRLYACSLPADQLSLEQFTAADPARGQAAIMGQTVSLPAGTVEIRALLHATSAVAALRLLRDGEVLRTFAGNEVSYTDTGLPPGLHYYRLLAATPGGGALISNPVFVRSGPWKG